MKHRPLERRGDCWLLFASPWIVFLSLVGTLHVDANPVSWGQFRVPNSSGLAGECVGLPTEFGPNQNLIWKIEVPPGHSSPIVTGEYLFLTAFQGQKLYALGIERSSGKILWQREVPRNRNEELHKIGRAHV